MMKFKIFFIVVFVQAIFFSLEARPAYNQASINVKDYGAKGNGVIDDTKAIQSAIDKASQEKKTVFFPSGTYLVSHILIKSSIKGANKTVLKRIEDASLNKYQFCNVRFAKDLYVSNIIFDGSVKLNNNIPVAGAVPLMITAGNNINIVNCQFQNSPVSGLRIENSEEISVIGCSAKGARGIYGDGYYIETSKDVIIKNSTAIDYTRIGFVTERNSINIKFINCKASNGHSASILRGGIEYNAGFWFEKSLNIEISNCTATNNTHYGFVASTGKYKGVDKTVFKFMNCESLNNPTGFNVSSTNTPAIMQFIGCKALNVSRGFSAFARNFYDIFTFESCSVVMLSKIKPGVNDACFQWDSKISNDVKKLNLPIFNYIKCRTGYTGKVPIRMINDRNTNNADLSTYSGQAAIINVEDCINTSISDGFVIKAIKGTPVLNIRNTKVNLKYMIKNENVNFF